jgi:lipopolysaccharide assembly outer membrane protein LptD (OstA)
VIHLGYKFNAKYKAYIVKMAFLLLLTIVFSPFSSIAQSTKAKKVNSKPVLANIKDTIKAKTDTVQADSTNVTTIRMSKDSIDGIVDYNAADSGVMIMKTKEFFLYGNAKTIYRSSILEAANIVFDQQSQNIRAYGASDTSGNPMSKPKFIEGEMSSLNDSIFYNLKSSKGLTKNTNFQQGEIFVNAKTMKKVSVNEAFAWKAKFTTCNLDEPHFAFVTNKLKIITDKVGMSGPIYPEIEGVPIPVEVPFAMFPLTRGKHSGFMAPAFSTSEDFGLGFEGLGYYKVLSDNFDATVKSNIYSYGGWSANLNSKYIKR